ncbi:MAG: RICIN domain-containing protein [Acidimicrobiales bacterium]
MARNLRGSALRRALIKAAPLAATMSLLSTGVIVPSPKPKPGPILQAKSQLLSLAKVKPGYFKSVDTGLPTELVGFEWKSRKPGAVEVRVKQGTAWGGWTRVDGVPEEGPDRGSKELKLKTTAGPLWVGKDKRRIEVRVVQGELDGLKLHAIRSENAPAAPGLRPAAAAVPAGAIIGRAEWDADESFRKLGPGCTGRPEYAASLRMAVVHHTATANTYGREESAAVVRAIYYFHTQTNGWCDIGYNFLVDRFGQVFEGRAGGLDRPVVAAHASGFNYASTGVAVLGSYSTAELPSPAEASVRRVLAWKLALHGVDPDGRLEIAGRTVPTIVGHGELGSTTCPGTKISARLPAIRAAAKVANRPELVVSVPSGKGVDLKGGLLVDGTAVVQAPITGSATQRWLAVALPRPGADPAGGPDPARDVFLIASAANGKVLDVAGASTADGAPVILWPWNGGRGQQWRLEPVEGGTRVVSVATGKVLDLAGSSSADGTPLVQWPWAATPSQLWQVRPATEVAK